MAGYIGTKAVNLSTTGADIAGDADVSGALDVGGAITGVNAILSGGVVFGDAGGSGTPTSNSLDSYEEGDWTPTFTLSSTNPDSVVYNTSVTAGFYRKIGNYVFVSGTLYTSGVTIGSGAGTLQIGNLPFAVANSSQGQNAYSSVYIGEATAFLGHHPSSGRFIQSNTSINLFYKASSNGGSLSSVGGDLNTGVNKNLLRFSGSYTT